MIDIEAIFRYKVQNADKLCENGFERREEVFFKTFEIMNGRFELEVNIKNGVVSYKVTDVEFGDEYDLVYTNSGGGFAEEVRKECERVLADVAELCFDSDIFKTEQTKRVISFIETKFSVKPEFLWEKYSNYAVFRSAGNSKWFAIIMTVARGKIGLDGNGDIEIINLKATPDEVSHFVESKEYFPAYHMNKKHWYTVCLDGRTDDETLFELIKKSRLLSGGKEGI